MANLNLRQNQEFTEHILPRYPLDDAVSWIKTNLEPEDVFDTDRLDRWAADNGYTLD